MLHMKLCSQIILSRVLFNDLGDLLGIRLLLRLNACVGASLIDDAAHNSHRYFIAV